jgi:hypothetical protein
VWSAVYVIAFIAVRIFLTPYRLDAVHIAAGLLLFLPLALIIRECYFFFFELDELQRRIQTDGLVITILFASALVVGIGVLQVIAKVPTFNIGWLFVPIAMCYKTAVFVADRRYS